MKTTILMTLAACTSIFAIEGPQEPFIEKNIRELPQSSFFSAMQGQEKNLIVAFSAGDTFPMQFNVSGSLVELSSQDSRPYSLTFKQDVYVCIPQENVILFSADKKEWKPLMEFITGSMSAYAYVDKSSGELISKISLHADKR
ncbi:MAG: hypothetical protein SP4CHLAM5_09390 [Chlamydiia bacterium]|nr:hypothetical protein [Chlamydiia bacterium]MCH9618798.1 hypothetical protein [Chlamydiia bacterium]MCH9624609.1 hypothetical protein [Chlamydiia bacterium]